MRIYIHNVNLRALNNIHKSLTELLTETKSYIEVYTNESIYQIDDKYITLLEPKDGEITFHQNYYENISLIVDKSYFQKTNETSVYGNKHLHKLIRKYIYKLNPKSKVSFVVETSPLLDDITFAAIDSYFECTEQVDIKELFIRQEINEFLSLLN